VPDDIAVVSLRQGLPMARFGGSLYSLVAAALLCVTVLSSCTGIVYNRVDWVVSWYVSDLVTLDGRQKVALSRLVDKTMAWHRETELPRYVTLLERLAAESGQPFGAAALEAHYQEVSRLLDDFARRAAPDVAGFLRTLNRDQVREMRGNFAEANEELWEDYGGATAAERSTRRTKNAVRALQRFTGRLTGEQRRLLASNLSRMHDVSPQWLERRRHWQERFLELVDAPPAENTFAEALLDLALNPNQFDDADYRRKVDENRLIVMKTLSELSRSFTLQQRNRLRDRFLDLAQDLQKISDSG